MPDIKSLLQKIWHGKSKPAIPADTVANLDNVQAVDLDSIKNMGVSMGELSNLIQKSTYVNFDRFNLYKEVERAVLHPLVGAAVELYADVATTYSTLQGATVWVKSDSRTIENELNGFLDRIGIEEKIFDWAWNVSMYGDLFVRMHGEPGLGVVNIDDGDHPMNMGRVDVNGRLIGFYRTQFGMVAGGGERTLMPPWDYVHFRILGVKKKRPFANDPTASQFATVHIMAPDVRRVSTRYGTSILNNALPTYKRLRLSEDSLLLARLSRGLLRYVYKVKVDGSNYESVAELITEYKTLLKRARAVDTGESANFEDKYFPMQVNEDVIIPVWGDVNDLQVDKIGGEPNIRWITDIEELRNQLASALRVPLQLLGGYTEDMPGGIGRSALERYDIRFARQSRRVQRAVIDGITRMCQIHLAYMGMDSNPSLFNVQMPETSTAEEEELKDALDKGSDVVSKLVSMVVDTVGEDINRIDLLDYLNNKILKLDDFDIRSFLKTGEGIAEAKDYLKAKAEQKKERAKIKEKYAKNANSDFLALLPTVGKKGEEKKLTENTEGENILNQEWEDKFSKIKVLDEKKAKTELAKQKRATRTKAKAPSKKGTT